MHRPLEEYNGETQEVQKPTPAGYYWHVVQLVAHVSHCKVTLEPKLPVGHSETHVVFNA
jgi:hypothetical protein